MKGAEGKGAKEGWNPKRKVKEIARRRRVRIDEDLPAGSA